MRLEPSLPFPFSSLRHDDDFVDETVVEAVDSPLFAVRLVRVVTDVDEILDVRGKLSIDDWDDANFKFKHSHDI